MKLYPPYIEGTIPAFYKDSKGTVTLTVPFSMNRAVSASEVKGFLAKIKTVLDNHELFTLQTENNIEFDIEDEYQVEFKLSENQAAALSIGDFYKIQLAYIHTDGTSGYYSTVGVTKYTTKPLVRIDNLTLHVINAHDYIYTGLYRQYETNENGYNTQDTTEKEYAYLFILTDREDNVIEDTGVMIHNCEKDTETYESIDEYSYYSDIPKNTVYYLLYIVYTNNNMTIKSPKYKIVLKKSIPPEIKASIKATMNFDNGYVDVSLVGDLDEEGMEKATTGAFLITRACSDDHYLRWDEVFRFTLHGQLPSLKLLRDFTIEQGKEYIYSLQLYNDYGLYSDRLLSNVVMGDFEDIFLYDGERLLKIKYNPKVSSFKTNILETKIDTIGTKYPFIFRNGRVEYKEFPISGLISYLSDEENLFITDDELGLTEGYADVRRPGTLRKDVTSDDDEFFWQFTDPDISSNDYRELYKKQEAIEDLMKTAKPRTTLLVDYNMSAERTFKLAVLNWLNDGRTKLFRSPSEGNYLVRLMNVSLTPEDKLSRMIHSFQATAYEMADCTYENMLKEDIIAIKKPDLTLMRWEGLELATDVDPHDDRYVKIGDIWYLQGDILTSHSAARSVRFDGLVPGSIVYVRVKGEEALPVEIGVTGSYLVDVDMDLDIIRIPDGAQYQGTVTYSYYNDAQNVFNEILSVDVVDYLGQQYIGELSNILDKINNVKFTMLEFYYLHFNKRYIESYEEYKKVEAEIENINKRPLYLEKAETITVNNTEIIGIKSIDNAIVKRDLVGKSGSLVVSNRYYYVNGGRFVSAGGKAYSDNIAYYIKEPLNRYHDFSNKNAIIVDQDTYDRIMLYVNITNGSKENILNNLQLISYKISIDGHTLDLEDKEEFNIDEKVIFDSIEIDNGVVLECGYQLQEVTYTVEGLDEVTDYTAEIDGNTVNVALLYNEYMYYLSADYFYELRDGLIDDSVYVNNVINAREELPAIYPAYMALVEREKIIWEANEHYE